MTDPQIEKLILQLERREKAITKERDRLDNLIERCVDLKECCEDAACSIDDARDALSRLL